MNKTIRVSITVAIILAIATIGFANATPRTLKQVNMLYSTSENPDKWLPVPGNQVSDFKLTLDESVEWYYLDIKFIKPTLPAGVYMFWLEPPTDPDFWTYWDAKGVNSAAPHYLDPPPPPVVINWKWVMWHIIYRMGTAPDGTPLQSPMFGLRSDGNGNYMLVDALVWFLSGLTLPTHLRLNGDYPKGTYTFTCYVASEPNPPYDPMDNVLDGVAMTITFR